uniref:Spore coat protein n=1 Tax=Ascaris lumbricoides TaxID=6252 RepID=A0A0M3IQ54_ASCLU
MGCRSSKAQVKHRHIQQQRVIPIQQQEAVNQRQVYVQQPVSFDSAVQYFSTSNPLYRQA